MLLGTTECIEIGEELFFIGRDEIFVKSFFYIFEGHRYPEIPAGLFAAMEARSFGLDADDVAVFLSLFQ